MKIEWPEGKKFAFTVFDDTDLGTVENLSPIYSFLREKGFLTTKSVWVFKGDDQPNLGGLTCDDEAYLKWVKQLAADGFEIASHGVTYHSSDRELTIKGYEKFYEMFGMNPDSYATHLACTEGVYDGKYRVSGLNRLIYNLATGLKYNNMFTGHVENNKYFWGDICKERIKYTRGYVFDNINTLKSCHYMPYHDPDKPYVNYWFCSSDGAVVNKFNNTISEENQDLLEAEGGACIMYTHFACGFLENGRINERFAYLMERMSKMDGWFMPVNKLLNYLLLKKGEKILSYREKKLLEKKWLLSKFRTAISPYRNIF